MKIDITQLLSVFDDLLPATNEEQGVYWFKTLRADGVTVTLAFSIYESYVDIIIHSSIKTVAASLSLENCSDIRVLDEKKKCLEIVHNSESGRCFLALLGDSVLEYSE